MRTEKDELRKAVDEFKQVIRELPLIRWIIATEKRMNTAVIFCGVVLFVIMILGALGIGVVE